MLRKVLAFGQVAPPGSSACKTTTSTNKSSSHPSVHQLPAYLSSSSRPSKTLTTQPHESNRSMTSWMLKPKAGRTQ